MRTANPPRTRRLGVVLLVVLALLALFSAVALSFVLYAESQASASRLSVQAVQGTGPDADPELLLAYYLNQLLFDARDDASGVTSALRGHSLMRSMWGAPYEFGPNNALLLGNSTVAFNGTGRLHQTYDAAAPFALRGQDDHRLINYTHFPADGFLRDPERLGLRSDPASPRGAFFGGFNPPYTYPDLNNLYLAAMKADGTVTTPSYHRPWLFGPLDPGNPHWTSPEGKYLLLRPRPAEHPVVNGKPGFPFPDDATGDVKNTVGPGGNDSVWLDLGFPVLTHADGRKFKPLFAPLLVDLDGRVNLNTHGNLHGAGGGHASNQGWGPWEVNLSRVCGADAAEWQNLFLGGPGATPSVWGRYGPDRLPTPLPAGAAAFGSTPPGYSRVDFDGCQANGLPSPPLRLPTGTQCFPTFPAGFDNADATELARHASQYHVVGPLGKQGAAYDRRFRVSHLEALLRFGDTNSPALTSDVAALLPKNFANSRFRRLVTTASNDLNRPGVSPWNWSLYPTAQVMRGPRYPDAPEKLLGIGATAFPAFPNSPTLYDDFLREGRAGDAPLTRVDVNRPLPAYPQPDATTRKITDAARFADAQQARQELSRDIFLRLLKATGAYDPTRFGVSVLTPPSAPDLLTLRWLAQWSVNIVDFIDRDDFSTPFPWAKLCGSPTFAASFGAEWVFGVEMPRVLINEAYGEYVNRNGETGKGMKAKAYHVHLWVELFNPVPTDPTLNASGDAEIDGAYQLLVTKQNRTLLSADDLGNVLGDPDNTSATQDYDLSQIYQVIDRFTPATISASDKAGGGLVVLGPADPVPGVGAWDPGTDFGTMRTGAMSFQFPIVANPVATPAPPSVLLRRLACPHLPWQPRQADDSPTTPYNPYVTVDYAENISLNNGATNNGVGLFGQPTPLDKRRSQGRVQPSHGHPQYRIDQAPLPALQNQPQHTLFAHNQDAVFDPRPAFDWLVHLDRPLISPMELVHVACCRPYQVTHLFKDTLNDSYTAYNHAPYWMLRDPASPLHRALELLETGSRARGAAGSDQIPGRINLNTVWDPETFLALCDPQGSNYFDTADVAQIYQWMIASRTPGGAPGPNDRPFKSLASANFVQAGSRYADGAGIADTWLRENPRHPKHDAAKRPIRLFEVVKKNLEGDTIPDHPYQRHELMTKIFSQVTTRSNVFAVWLTVGFFEVNDDTTRPVKLGAEIGRSEGRQVRHRMFAVVDRTALVPLLPGDGQPVVSATTPIPAAGATTVVPSQMSGINGKAVWSIQPGMVLRVSGLDATGTLATEDVAVTATSPVSFTANFRRAYPGGLSAIRSFGNPGPSLTAFNPARRPDLVPYFNVIR